MKSADLYAYAQRYKQKNITGRYVHNKHLEEYLEQSSLYCEKAAYSVENRVIYTLTFGIGNTKILMWSQMHGNESTTCIVLSDFLIYIQSVEDLMQVIWK